MNKRVKKLWLKALRSGEYEQGRGQMLDSTEAVDKFCCLGVLCDLHARETGDTWSFASGLLCYKGSPTYLPWSVQRWAGLHEPDPCVPCVSPLLRRLRLSKLNDRGASFDEIADAIEKEL